MLLMRHIMWRIFICKSTKLVFFTIRVKKHKHLKRIVFPIRYSTFGCNLLQITINDLYITFIQQRSRENEEHTYSQYH